MDEWNMPGKTDWNQVLLKREQEISPDTKCSFCGKRRDQVDRFTAGPGNVYICDECIDLWREHIENTQRDTILREKIMHTCGTCGTIAPTGHRYCYNCGTQFAQQANS